MKLSQLKKRSLLIRGDVNKTVPEFIKKNNFRAQLIFQPTWGSSIKLLTEKVLNDNLKVRVLPQLHKDIWGDLKGK